MTLVELEMRVATLEQKLAQLGGKLNVQDSDDVNAWIDQVHGTFQNDKAYREAARLGSEWRKSYRRRAGSPSRKIAGK